LRGRGSLQVGSVKADERQNNAQMTLGCRRSDDACCGFPAGFATRRRCGSDVRMMPELLGTRGGSDEDGSGVDWVGC